MPSSWTLQAASGGPENTLAEWGFTGATRSGAVQSDDVVTLTRPTSDACTASDLWAWETELILRRDGEVYYRGYLAATPRSLSPDSESMTYELRSLWWILSRITYRQTWAALTGDSMGTVQTGRVRLGATTATRSLSAMVGQLTAYAATLGITLTVDLSEIGDPDIPPIEGHNRTITDLLRAMLRWLPDVALVPVYTEAGTTYRARLASSTPVEVITIGDAGLAALDITSLPELQVDAVQIIYEATASESTYDEAVDGDGFSVAERLVGATDTYPLGATITRRSLVLTLPYPSPPGDAGSPAAAQPNIASQPIVTETWPEDGATDATCQQWWLDRSSLGTLGLTVADILLTSSSASALAHKVIIDPADIETPPSAVNPESTPVWKPAAATDTPRELISGSLADWMPGSIKAYSLIAEATIVVKKSAVDALPEAQKKAFLRLGYREKRVTDIACYLLDAVYKFTGTNAVTKVYSKVISIDYGGVSSTAGATAATGVSYAEAVAAAVIPGLARRLYEARSTLNYSGSLPLSQEEAPLTSHLGRRVCLSHSSRPEWGSMAAQVSQETVDLFTGTVNITFGPPPHLEAADWAELHRAARQTQDHRASAAASPPAVQNPSPDEGDPEDPAPPRNAVIGGSITPDKNFQWQGGAAPVKRPWDLTPDAGATFKLYDPVVIWKRSDITSFITITNTAFTPSSGKYLVAKITSLTTPTITVELLSTGWTDYPEAYEFTGVDHDFTAARIPLWHFTAVESEGAIEIATDVWAKKLVPSDVLRLVFPLYAVPTTTALRSVPDLL